MAQTLYASFADASLAEKAVGALLDYGARQEDISLVTNDERGRAQRTEGAALGSTAGYGTDTSAGAGRAAGNLGDRAVDDTKSAGDRIAQAGDRVAGAVTGAVGADATSASFHAAADERAARADTRAAMAGNEDLVHGSPAEAAAGYPTGSNPSVAADRTVYTTGAGGTTAGLGTMGAATDDVTDANATNRDDTDTAAKHGISTTTPQDAGAGAAKGAGIGLGVGVVAALASLLVPGVGLVTGAGALATAIGGAVGATVAGGIAGGVTGYLKEQGVPGEAVERYQGAVEHGGALLALQLPSGKVDRAEAEQVIAKYGGSDVNAY